MHKMIEVIFGKLALTFIFLSFPGFSPSLLDTLFWVFHRVSRLCNIAIPRIPLKLTSRYTQRGRKRPKHSFSSIKFTPWCVLWHYLKFSTLPPVTINNVQYTVCVGYGGAGLCWRPYTAGLLHSVWGQIQSLENCLTNPRKKLSRGGLQKNKQQPQSPFQVTEEILHCLLWVLSFYGYTAFSYLFMNCLGHYTVNYFYAICSAIIKMALSNFYGHSSEKYV